MEALQFVLLIILGFVAGAYGTIIGAGGGFVLVPVMALLPFPAFQAMSPQTLTGISLAVVFCNGVSAVIAYLRQKRIDIFIATVLGLFAIPGSILGRYVVTLFDRSQFEAVFGTVLVGLAIYLVVRKPPKPQPPRTGKRPITLVTRTFTPANQEPISADVDLRIAALAAFIIGFLAALFGVGGGLMMVPILVTLLRFPPPFATATSQMFLLYTSAVSVMTDLVIGGKALTDYYSIVIPLAIGVIVGAQGGARISRFMTDRWILRLLAAGLGLAGLRLIYSGLTG